MVEELIAWLMDTALALVWLLKLLAHLCLFTLFSLQLIPKETQEILMFLCWHHFPLGLLCLWFIWQLFRSPEPESTLLVVSELLLCSTRTSHGMTIGYSGLDHSLELPLLQFITSISSEQELLKLLDPSEAAQPC
ncbi:hypothetical protein Goshw_023791, partial [Gossypium schwendimanii]|nr:hypothetical protein [Gossypium schwendimanii]